MMKQDSRFNSVAPVVLLLTGLVVCLIDTARFPDQQPARRPIAAGPQPYETFPERAHIFTITPRSWADDRTA